LSEVDSSLPQTLGGICRLLPVVAFLHVFLAYPDGRLAPRLERPLVIAGYTSVLGFSFAAMFLGPTNVDSLIAIANRQRHADVLLATARISVAAVALVSLALIVRRARSSGHRLRQSLVRVCFVLALLAIALAVIVRVGSSGSSEVPMRSVAISSGAPRRNSTSTMPGAESRADSSESISAKGATLRRSPRRSTS